MDEYSRKKQEQILSRQMQELERELQAATVVHKQSERYLEASKEFDKVIDYQ